VDAASGPVVTYLSFFRDFDSPRDEAAYRAFARVVREAPDFERFVAMVPPGSEERALVERFLGAFETAGELVRAGRMSEDLLFDGWYHAPAAWRRAEPYVGFLRRIYGEPERYASFEWLAGRAASYWQERELSPRTWLPLDRDPTEGDERVFSAWNAIWSSERDAAARRSFAALEREAPAAAEFVERMQPGSDAFIQLDRVLCAYDQAGTLIKNGVLHPELFAQRWRSPSEFWPVIGPLIAALRAERGSSHAYENVDWLVGFEQSRRG
jgi:hypothetical protein